MSSAEVGGGWAVRRGWSAALFCRGSLALALGVAAAVAAAAEPPTLPDAQTNPAADAAFVRAVYADWYVPRSTEFEAQAGQLVQALAVDCAAAARGTALAEAPVGIAGPRARAQWLATVGAWERLSAVRAGALLARRSPREIDFAPARPEAIERAIRSAPGDAAALDTIGSPAKGLPALEWLLWSRPTPGEAAACAYAQLAAEAVLTEAEALLAAYRRSVAQGWDAKESEYAMYEFLNLWDAGLQKLWWEEMERPAQKAQDGRAPLLSRAASGHTVAGWRQQWQALRALALGDGQGRGPSLRARLLADGRLVEADGLAQRVAAVDQAMAAIGPMPTTSAVAMSQGEAPAQGAASASMGAAAASPAATASAVTALKDLQQFAETDMAAALHFIISFFDEDGD